MKKILFLIVVLLAIVAVNAQNVIYSENFDAMTAGEKLITQTDQWTTWSGGINSESGTIDNSISQSAPNALLIQGSNDVIYPTHEIVFGHYAFDFDYYIPSSGNGGYFSVLHKKSGNSSYAFECYLGQDVENGEDLGSRGILFFSGNTGVVFNYPEDTWFHIRMDFNLDQDSAKFIVDGEEIASWLFSSTITSPNSIMNKLDAIDFYAGCMANASGDFTLTGTYYIDNFTFSQISGVGIEERETTYVEVFPNPVSNMLNVNTANANTLEIANLLGQVIFTQPVTEEQTQVDVSNLNSGVYFVRLKGEKTVTRKFVKK